MSFALSISILSLCQAALVALPRPFAAAWTERFRSPWWALVPALSIVVVIGIVAAEGESATALTWLALLAVPPLAAAALGWLVRGADPAWAAAVPPLFGVAWAAQGSLLGEVAATVLTGLACVSLGWALAAVAPPRLLRWGVYAMAAVDVWLVATEQLQAPNDVLSAAAPAAELPQLQVVHLGSAVMGFGDLFVAATLGALLVLPATTPPRFPPPSSHFVPHSGTKCELGGKMGAARSQLVAAGLVAALALASDLLFFVLDTLPATVPVALALALVELRERRRTRRQPDRVAACGAGPPAAS